MIDWKKNNKISLRNFSEAVDFHDVVKTMIVRMLRRNYPDSHSVPIYTEFRKDDPNKTYPDIWMRIKSNIIVWEIQKEITKKWLSNIQKNYENVDLIIVDLKKVEKQWNKLLKNKKYINPIDLLKEALADYII